MAASGQYEHHDCAGCMCTDTEVVLFIEEKAGGLKSNFLYCLMFSSRTLILNFKISIFVKERRDTFNGLTTLKCSSIVMLCFLCSLAPGSLSVQDIQNFLLFKVLKQLSWS